MSRRRRGRRRGQPTEVASVLPRVLGEIGLDDVQRAFEIARLWEEAVGAEVASHARPVALRGDVLDVAVDSSVWAQQLQLRRPELLAALGRLLPDGGRRPGELRFRVGYTAPQ